MPGASFFFREKDGRRGKTRPLKLGVPSGKLGSGSVSELRLLTGARLLKFLGTGHPDSGLLALAKAAEWRCTSLTGRAHARLTIDRTRRIASSEGGLRKSKNFAGFTQVLLDLCVNVT
jgi:hypothetical protein